MSISKNTVFKGAATALVTPFKNGDVDYVCLGELIDWQIASGIDALVICGTTGESSTLSDSEHRLVLRFSLARSAGRVPMIAGTGSNDTYHAIEMSKYACDLGYDALLTVTPYYNKATPTGLIKSYMAIADAVTRPIILYNVPTRTCCNITLDVYRELSAHPNIVAVKEASGNMSAISELFAECGADLDIYSGNDDQTLPMMSLGGAGVISVVSNIIPNEMSLICKKWFDGDIAECRRLHERYLRLMRVMFCEVNPIPVKTALHMLGRCSGELRLPLCEPTDGDRARILCALGELGLIG